MIQWIRLLSIMFLAVLLAACSLGNDYAATEHADTPEPKASFMPASGGMRRLSSQQYTNSVRLIFGENAAQAAKPPPDAALYGFKHIGGTWLIPSPSDIEAYEKSARDVAKAIVNDPEMLEKLVQCMPDSGNTECYSSFIKKIGRLVFRRPLDNTEVNDFVQVGNTAADKLSFNAGLEYIISGLLQSPDFLYAVEVGEIDQEQPSYRKLSSFELASRMSFFLLNTTPDEALLDKVEADGLTTEKDIRATAQEMIERPEARLALENFFLEVFQLQGLDSLQKDQVMFPQYTSMLGTAMQQEVLKLIEDIVLTRNGDFREIFTANYAFVNSDLAKLYGITASYGGFEKIPLPPEHKRAGILGSAAFLARFSHSAMTSPTKRGLFIQSVLLCTEIEPPPPGANTTFPPDIPGKPQTTKDKLLQHQQNPSCGGCHKQIDPLGLAFEHFDALGVYRQKQDGLSIDTTGQIEGFGSFENPKDIGELLKNDPRTTGCIINNLYRNAIGHPETDAQRFALAELIKVFTSSGYSLKQLLVEIVASPVFRLVSEPK